MPLRTQRSNSKKYLNLSSNGSILRPLQKAMRMKALADQRAKNEELYQQQRRGASRLIIDSSSDDLIQISSLS